MTFHEVAAKSALNHVPSASAMPFDWTVNPYRGCSHACSYCFARGTHAYLDLDAGRDFDEQIVVKVNVAEVLRRELAAPSWQHEPVALGTNTDPYQRAEGATGSCPRSSTPSRPAARRSRCSPRARCCGAIFRCSRRRGVGARPPRDVDRHARRALRQTLEAGAPTFQARLDTVRAATEAGFAVTVFLMPIVPHLTDSVTVLDDALARIAASGGSCRLRSTAPASRCPGVVLAVAGARAPGLVPAYRGLYPGATVYAPAGYRKWLAARVRPLLRRHRLTGGPKTRSRPGPRDRARYGRPRGQRHHRRPRHPPHAVLTGRLCSAGTPEGRDANATASGKRDSAVDVRGLTARDLEHVVARAGVLERRVDLGAVEHLRHATAALAGMSVTTVPTRPARPVRPERCR
jgi:hypothetical protein